MSKRTRETFSKEAVEYKQITLLPNFINEYGEEYQLYQLNGFKGVFFITGDELDWEWNWRYDRATGMLHQDFMLNKEEREKIEGYISLSRTK